MSKRRHEVDARVLTVFFLVAIPFLAIGSLVVIHLAREHLETVQGQSLEQRAQQTRQMVERYVLAQFTHLHLVSLDPQVEAAVAAPAVEAAVDEQRRLDQAWAAADAGLVASVTATPLAGRLRELGRVQPALKLLQVIDGRGRLLATTGRGGRIWNGETSWFRALGDTALTGRPYVADIVRPAGGSPMFELDYPIRDSADSRLVGAVRGLYDLSDLYSVLASVRMGRTGHAVLLRNDDGLVLAGDESSRVLKERFPGFEFITAGRREQRGFWSMPPVRAGGADEPARIVGFASVEQVPGVAWTVAVEQDVAEAVGPVRSIGWFLLLHFIGVIGTAIVLALYFSTKLEAPVIEEELHLHEEHVPERYRTAS